MKRPLLLCTLLAGTAFAAKERATFRYTAPPEGERPVIVNAVIGPQGSDFAMRLRFDKVPFGDACKNRCANTTVLLDTDNSKQTGLRLAAKNAPGNGADVAVIIQGVRDHASQQGAPPASWLRVKVRLLGSEASTLDDGELLAELNHRQDPERLHVDGETLYLLVDATSPSLPAARRARVVYQPPGARPLQATIPGMIGGGSGKGVRIFKDGSWGKARDATP